MSDKYDFPKIIHQMWIGEKKKPTIFLNEWSNYIKNNPDWKYEFWDENRINKLNLKCKELYDYNISNEDYPAASDHFRYEILKIYGGIWCDADSVPMNDKSMNFFIENMNSAWGRP